MPSWTWTSVSLQKTTSESDPHAVARSAALRLLARREHGVSELALKLQRKGHAATVVRAVLSALEAEGLLSERRYAEAYARSRMERGYGPLRITQELRDRGVDGAAAESALAALDSHWSEQIERLERRRFGHTPRAREDEALRMRFLRQRGFSTDQVRRHWRGE